ncbi:unnamed protein product [Paramecium sonneborni]|uniref:MIR domain protein n=1 Tax=Paramecium sonneborni TaxID=65129 RepID=A0A8S1LPC9_9CILI|nr:unnamed protein product [Paramecium sonneborni]
MEQEEITTNLQQIVQEDENQNNVRHNDIIYLKSYLPEDNKGLISGDGFATNKVECLLLQKQSNDFFASKQTDFLPIKQPESLQNKSAEWNIFKCLFRILDSNRFNIIQSGNECDQETQIEIQEPNESDTNIIYGQDFYLQHLYSKCYLTLNSQTLAKENCCRELRLEEKNTLIPDYSKFMFQSNTKSYGEPVVYGDILFLKSGVPHLIQWGLGISQKSPFSDVHASQIASKIRICNYVVNDNEIMNGDIIVFKNRLFGGYLSLKREKSSTKLLKKRNIYKNNQILEQDYIDLYEFKSQENLDEMFNITLEKDLQLNSLWQLIGFNKKVDKIIYKSYIIRNVLTGTFLFIENGKLGLSYNGLKHKNEFQIKNLKKAEQKINSGQFYRILRIQKDQNTDESQTFIIQCSSNNEVNITTNCQKTQYDQQLFKVAKSSNQDAMAANKIQAFYFGIVDFYIFLQDWALDKELKYQYYIAVYNQKQLQDEINQFKQLLKNINSFLDQDKNVIIEETKQNQFNLCKNDILDLLIKLQQLVNLIQSQDCQKELDQMDKTAERIARQKFEKKKNFDLIEEVYQTIYSIIYDNFDCCNQIIQEDTVIDFLFTQLSQHREQIEKIFKQIVSKARYNPNIAEKWINRISTITEINLEDQIFIITIINLFISQSQQVSVEGQNLCRKMLFQNKKCKLLKCLIIEQLPLPILEIEAEPENFAKNNEKFYQDHHTHYPNLVQNQICFEYFTQYDLHQNYHKYEQYLLNIMNLYAIMCRGRNFKNIQLIKNVVGINDQFFRNLIHSKHSLSCKQAIIELLSSLYFDIDPLTKISIFENTCYLSQALQDFNQELESGTYFYENISSINLTNSGQFKKFQETLVTQENMKDLLYLKQFSSHIITSQKYHEYYIKLFLQDEYPQILRSESNGEVNYKKIAKIQLQFFLSLIRLIKNSIDLGYNKLSLNKKIQETLPNIFFILKIQQNSEFKKFEFIDDKSFQQNKQTLEEYISSLPCEKSNKSWIAQFLLWTTSICTESDLIEQIFLESLNIYKVLFYLQANLQILQYLTQKQNSELFKNHNTILFTCLLGKIKFPNLNSEILKYLIQSFNNYSYNYKEIKEVEILDDKIEQQYFGIINGHYGAKDVQGPKEIQQCVKKAIKYIQSDNQRYKESFQKISQYIQNLNQLFEKIIKENPCYFKSFQNMVRNAGIHHIFVEFIMNPDLIIENEDVVYFYKSVLKFWENFIRGNQTNLQILKPKLDVLFKILLIPQPLFLGEKFLYKSLSISKLEIYCESSQIIDIIINITNSLNLIENLIHIRAGRQYLKVLKGFTKTPTKLRSNQISNQKEILHLTLQNFRNLIDPNQYFLENNQKDKQIQTNILRYSQLKLHSTALNLISESCENYYLGISETQRILLFEQLIIVLQEEPYIVKAAYLRCIFELYINSVESNDLYRDLIDNRQINELFKQIIIPDFQKMEQFNKYHHLGNSILLNNKEYWKYIKYVFEFLILVIDEFKIQGKLIECNFIENYKKILILIQDMLLNSSNHFISENSDYIKLITKIIESFVTNQDFNLEERLQIYCIRQKIQQSDLIDYVDYKYDINNLEKICNINNKIYVKQEDKNDKSWISFKKKASSFQNEINQSPSSDKTRQKAETNLQDLKEKFQVEEENKVKEFFKEKGWSSENQNLLSEDSQIQIFLHELQSQSNNFFEKNNFKDFLNECKQIFSQNSNYLIKLCKIFLEMKKPDKKAIFNDESDNEKHQEKYEQFTIFQNLISECEIHVLAIEQLNHQNMNEQLDSLTLLHHLLDFGNAQVQQRFFILLQNHKKHKKIFIQFFKDFYNADVNKKLENLSSSKNTNFIVICIKVLQVLQGLCENVHIEFQKFLRIQNLQDSITNNFNFVLQTTELIVNFLEDRTVDNSQKWDLYQQGLQSLIEFSTGDNENKKEIIKIPKLFSGFYQIFNTKITQSLRDNFDILKTLYIYIQLLLSLLEGNVNDNKSVYKFLLENLDDEFLLNLAQYIYNSRIRVKKTYIYVDKYCSCKQNLQCDKSFCNNGYVTKEDSLLIETGLNIHIIGLKLSNFSNDQKFKRFYFESERDLNQEDNKTQKDFNQKYPLSKASSINPQFTKKYTENQNQVTFLLDGIKEEKQNKLDKLPLVIQLESNQFYNQFIGRIEVVNQCGVIERILFQKPFVCKYITQNIKQSLIYESNRDSDEDRLSSLLENINFYHAQMIHYQKISTFPVMHFGQKYWRTLKDISFILCVFIVLFFILLPDDILDDSIFYLEDENNSQSKKVIAVLYLNNIITIIQIILNFIIIIFCAIERYPIAVNFRRGATNVQHIQKLKKQAGFKIPEYKQKYYEFFGQMEQYFELQKDQQIPKRKIIVLLLMDFDNFYNIMIFGITAIAFFNNYVYVILLLDIVKRSEVLKNIIKAFTGNTKNLMVFGFLGLIGLVLYGFLIKISFSDDFKDETKFASDSLGYSIAHVINFGLRNGGGIGDTLSDYSNPFDEPNQYWKRYFFDLIFFIIFNILFLQMIFGIIVDKFGELRDARQELLKDIKGKCFICSLERNEIDSKTKGGWFQHIFLEHNVYHMLFYLIYIKKKPITECNQLEKYIKDQIQNKFSEFIPVKMTYELQNQQKQQS